MVRSPSGLVDHEHDRRGRERIFLSALFSAIAAAARIAGVLWRCVAERTPLLEKHGDSKDGFNFAAQYSTAESTLAILVCPFLGRRGEEDLSRKLLCRNAELRGADRAGHVA